MHIACFFTLCAVKLVVIFLGEATEVTLENKGYKNILVSFSPTVSTSDGRRLIEEMENVLSESSGILSNAIGLKISQVTFLIPSTWDTSEWENVTIGNPSLLQTTSNADILVDGTTDSAFGKRPFTLQYGGCGVPGSKITVPTQFLKEESLFPKGKLVAREWLKYRYGVFDENGFIGDKMYPVYYKVSGSSDIEVSDCTDSPLKYNFRDVKGNNCSLKVNDNTGFPINENDGCIIHPDEESARNISSSLMYFKNDLPHLEHICGDEEHPHNRFAPTKHNTLCQGKSMWEILKNSPDFAPQAEVDFAEEEEGTEFLYVQQKMPRVVIAWEKSIKLASQAEILRKAIVKFLYDLPDGSKYGLYPYKEGKNEQISLKELKDWPNNRDVSIAIDFVSTATACTSCAISTAIDAFVQDSAAQDASQETGAIILFTATDPESDDTLLKKIKESQLCLIVFAFTDQGATSDGFNELLSSSPCGSFWSATSNSEASTNFDKIIDALESVLPHNTQNFVTKTKVTGYLQYDKKMNITVDKSMANVTLWIANVFDTENIQCTGSEAIQFNKAFESRTFTALYYNPQKAGEVSCSLKFETMPKTLTQVRITSKPGEYFESKIWIQDTTQKEDHQMPVIIYANINFGPYPVKNAEVKASVISPDGIQQTLDLYDDGRGDPDITEGDGIYSRYFTGFTSAGAYTVTIKATDNGGQSKASKNGLQQCCGSTIQSNDDVDLIAFEEVLQITFHAKSKKPENGYKPSRITDLRIVSSNISNVVLEWTAPGGEADSGKVEKYFIKLFTSEEEILKSYETSDDSATYNISIEPNERGKVESYVMDFNNFDDNTTYFIGIISMNNYSEFSEMSNIIKLFFSEQTEITTKDEITTAAPNKEAIKEAQANRRKIGIIIGVIVVVIVLVICAYVLVYIFVIKPKHEAEKTSSRKNNSSNERDKKISLENHTLNPLHSVRADVILKHHNEVVNAKNEHKTPPIFKEEDFQTQNSNDNTDNNANHAEYSQVVPKKDKESKDHQPTPPKSPKRMTFV